MTEVSNGKPSWRFRNFAEDRERASEAGRKGGGQHAQIFKNDPHPEAGKSVGQKQ